MTDSWKEWFLKRGELEAAASAGFAMKTQIRDRVLLNAGVKKGSSILDIGCGDGFLTAELVRLAGIGGKVTGLDSDEHALALAAERLNGIENSMRFESTGSSEWELIQADADELPLQKDSFDVCTARSVLIYSWNCEGVISEAARVLKRGARISLCEPILGKEQLIMDWGSLYPDWIEFQIKLRTSHPAYRLKEEIVINALQQAGFENIRKLTWHADVTRHDMTEEEALKEFFRFMPAGYEPEKVLIENDVGSEKIYTISKHIAAQSKRHSYRHFIPCLFVWADQ